MRNPAIALSMVCALALAGCATPVLNTPHAQLERAESIAEDAYQATRVALDAALASGKLTQAAYKSDLDQAATDINAVRTAYNAGQDITDAVAKVKSDQAAATAAKGN